MSNDKSVPRSTATSDEAASVSMQLIECTRRVGVDDYTKTLLLHASKLLDATPRPSAASSAEPATADVIRYAIRYLREVEGHMMQHDIDMLMGDLSPPSIVADRLEAALTTPTPSDAMTAAPATDEVREIVDLYFAPWGAAKGARWEDLSGDQPFNAEVAMSLIEAAISRHEGGAP